MRRSRRRVVAVERHRFEERAERIGALCVAEVVATHERGADLHVDAVEPVRDAREEAGAMALGDVAARRGFEHELHAAILRRIVVETLEWAARRAPQRVADRGEIGGAGIAPVVARHEGVAVTIFLLFEQPLEHLPRGVRDPRWRRHAEVQRDAVLARQRPAIRSPRARHERSSRAACGSDAASAGVAALGDQLLPGQLEDVGVVVVARYTDLQRTRDRGQTERPAATDPRIAARLTRVLERELRRHAARARRQPRSRSRARRRP